MKHKKLSTRHIAAGLAMAVAMSAAGTAQAVKFEFHGDLDNRFMLFTDQGVFPSQAQITDPTTPENFGNFKYRLWSTAGTDDGSVKGVFAIEVGAVRFGSDGRLGASTGGAFSGDGVNIETRWAYVDFSVGRPGRLKTGLQPFSLDKHLWKETAAGILLDGAFGGGKTKYQFAWMRGSESFNNPNTTNISDDLDALSAKFKFNPSENVKLGVFGLVQFSSNKADGTAIDCSPTGSRKGARCWEVKNFASGGADFDLISIGVDGGYTRPTGSGNFFINWDVIAQDGSLGNTTFTGTDGTVAAAKDFDISAQMARFEIGAKVRKFKYKYTLLWQSGDDNPNDRDFDAFLATDMDSSDSIIFSEESITSDFFLVETNYLFDKGIFQNRFDVDYQINKRLSVGGAVSLLKLAEDLEYVNASGTRFSSDDLGVEVSGRLKYKIAPRTEFQAQLAFLSADDAMDFFEGGALGPPQDGSSDEDIIKLNARVRYKF
jgi:hypothetical protein